MIYSMECVAFEYVLDFQLERLTSAKGLDMFFSDKSKIVCSFIYGCNNNQIVHHNPCFTLLILHDSFDNDGSEIKTIFFLYFNVLSLNIY